jgi:hypothetical protein
MKMTVGEFRKRLADLEADDWELGFNGLTFQRLKKRDEKLINIEFEESIEKMTGVCVKCGDYHEVRASTNGPLCSSCYVDYAANGYKKEQK